jgi:FkbM family methyltransferase
MAASVFERAKGIYYGRSAVLRSVLRHPLNRGSKALALRDYFLWNAVRFSMDARHAVTLPGGAEIILGRKENYGSAVYTHFLADYREMLFLAHALRREDLFLDVGANVGMYTVWVGTVTGAAVEAFEPVPDTYVNLCKNVRLNDLRAVETHRMAVGEAAGEVQMTANQGGLDHIVEGGGSGGVTVPVGRLDQVPLSAVPYAMKIDVEGFELKALKGAAGLLEKPGLKAILIELQDWTLNRFGTSEAEVRSLLTSFGFAAHSYNPFTRTLAPAGDEKGLNEIFVRPDDELRSRLAAAPRVKLPNHPEGV